jgi:MFS superfamily sulfate permease-like transporter
MVVELALFYFLYTGHNWARLVLGLLSLGIALFGWWTGFNIRDLNLAGILVFLCLGSSFLLAAGLLFLSPDVRAYFEERNST